jgi:vacuolar protein-sorting-associated protein 4
MTNPGEPDIERMLRREPTRHWGDVVGMVHVKERLKERIVLPAKFPQLFRGSRTGRTFLSSTMLFGPPGCGKTYIIHAAVSEAGCPFFYTHASEVLASTCHVTRHFVRLMFESAANAAKNTTNGAPVVLCIDDFDELSLAKYRDAPVDEAFDDVLRRVKVEFLVQMQTASDRNILVVALTNRPWVIDPAYRRRFVFRQYCGPPTEQDRFDLLKRCLAQFNVTTTMSDDELRAGLAAFTADGYTHSDLHVFARDLAMEPLRRLACASYFRQLRDEEDGTAKFHPCEPHEAGAFPAALSDLPSTAAIYVAPIRMTDFRAAVRRSRPTVTEFELSAHEKFCEDFAQCD